MLMALFYLTNILYSTYFFFLRKRNDVFTFAYASSAVYFCPGFIGSTYAIIEGRPIFDILIPIQDECYAVFLLVQLSLFFASIFTKRPKANKVAVHKKKHKLYTSLVLNVTMMVLLAYIVSNGSNIIGATSKQDLLTKIGGVGFTLVRTMLIIAIMVSFLNFRGLNRIYGVGFIFVSLTFGMKSIFVLPLIALLIHWSRGYKNPWQIIKRNFKFRYLAIILLLVFYIFLYKPLFGLSKHIGVSQAIELVLTDPSYLRRSLYSFEPIGIQLILNEMIIADYFIGPAHLMGVIYQIFPNPSSYGYPSSLFHQIFQRDLFPNVKYGMAYNIWAELLVSVGWWGLLVFLIIWNLLLTFFEQLSYSSRLSIKSLGLLGCAYLCFYIHRNSLATEIAFIKYILYVTILFSIIHFIVFNLFSKNTYKQLNVNKNNVDSYPSNDK